MDSRSSLNISEDLSTLAEEGLRTSIDNESFFNKANPLAVSTVGREKRTRQLQEEAVGGSFLDIDGSEDIPSAVPQKQLQLSFSACNQSEDTTDRLSTRDPVSSRSEPLLAPRKANSSTSVIGSWSGIQQASRYDSEDSRKSSLGILRVDEMSDLSSSLIHIEPPTQKPQDSRNTWKSTLPDNSQIGGSTSNASQGGSYADSGHWQNSSKQDSKTDQPIGRSHIIDTVKKRPSMMAKQTGSNPLLNAITSLAYGDVPDEHEADITVPDVQLLEDELLKLDEDFGDFNDLEQTCIDDEEDMILDENQEQEAKFDALDDIYLQPAIKHDGGDGAEGINPYPSLSKVSLFEDAGSTEDLNTPGRQSATASLRDNKLRKKWQQIDDGSEIDTEDELEMARQAIGQSKQTREEAAGRSSDTEHLVQVSTASVAVPRENGNGSDNDLQPLTIAMRQSAEGEMVVPLVPGDGGGGGDGSSGSDSEDVPSTTVGQSQHSANQAQSFLSAFQQSFRPIQPPPSERVDIEEQRVKPMGDDLLTEKNISRYSDFQGNHSNDDNSLLDSRFLNSIPVPLPGEVTRCAQWGPGLDSIAFSVDDQLQGSQHGSHDNRPADLSENFPGDRQEASGFNADDIFKADTDDNPFGMVESSFGSFGLDEPAQPQNGRFSYEMPPPQDTRFSNEESVASTTQYGEPQHSPVSQRTSDGNISATCYSPKRRVDGSCICIAENAWSHPADIGAADAMCEAEAINFDENVNDLAHKLTFSEVAPEQQKLLEKEGNQFLKSVIEDVNFVNSDEAQKMLLDDEKEFESENIFRQDEKMVPTDTPEDSWMFQSKMSVTCPSSMKDSDDDDPMRISIGTYMMGRSGALGSLDGDADIPRPSFGMKVTTPPNNRRPVPLIESPTNSRLSSVKERDSLDTRTSGVGDEEGDHTVVNGDSLTMSGLEETPKARSSNNKPTITEAPLYSSLIGQDVGPDNVFSPEKPLDDRLTMSSLIRHPTTQNSDVTMANNNRLLNVGQNQQNVTTDSPSGVQNNSSLVDSSGEFSVSEISKIISTASKDTSSTDLTNLILTLSNKMSKHKTGSGSKEKTVEQEINREKKVQTNIENPSETGQKTHSSRLPIRKGSNVHKHRHSSDSEDKMERKEKSLGRSVMSMSDLRNSASVHGRDTGNLRQDAGNLRKDAGNLRMLHKSNPDGKESDSEVAQKNVVPRSDLPALDHKQQIFDVSARKEKSSGETVTSWQTGQEGHNSKHQKSERDGVVSQKDSLEGRNLLNGQTVSAKELTRALKKARPSDTTETTSSYRDSSSLANFSREKQPADGQATSYVTAVSKSNYTSAPKYLTKTNDTKQNLDNFSNGERDVHMRGEYRTDRSPRSSVNSLGLTGHHIPDGTEYSFAADHGHVNDQGMSREDLVGTDDINTADSRGFDLIASGKSERGNLAHYHPSFHREELPHKLSSENIGSDAGPARSESSVGAKQLHRDSRSKVSDQSSLSPRHSTSVPNSSVLNTNNKQYKLDLDVASQERRFSSSPKPPKDSVTKSSKTNEGQKLMDELLMPPPPVPSFNHKLLPPKTNKTDPPLLLTKQSLLDTDFAKEYLVRDAPGQVVSKNIHPYPQNQASSGSVSSGNTPNFQHPDTPGFEHLEGRLSTFCFDPAYQSTPAVKPELMGNNHNDNTILTSSSMHSMMSTGVFEELIPSQSMSIREPSICIKPVPKKLTPVKAPGELRFEEVCCLGITTQAKLPLTNPTNDWIECQLRIKMLSIDGHVVENQSVIPFEMKSKVIIEPHKTEDVQVIFLPKVPGAFVAQLFIYSSLFLPNVSEMDKIPTEVSIQAIAEKPNIKVITEEHNKIDFGEMGWGTCREKTFTLINLGQALVPIRLAISSRQCPWHSFSFDPRANPDVSIISLSSRPQSPALYRIIKTFYLPGNDKVDECPPHNIKLFCCPQQKQSEKVLAQHPPCSMSARMDIEVDTPSSHIPTIASINLKSVIGVPKLHVDDQHLESVILKTSPGQKGTQKMMVMNAGNINITVHVTVQGDYEGIFFACPEKLNIPVGGYAYTVIEFTPKDAKVPSYETILDLSIQPDGPTYELVLRGDVVSGAQLGTTKPVVLADRQYLLFGGIPVGESRDKRVTLMNKSSCPIKLNLEITSSMPDFQLKSRGYPDSLSMNRDVILQPAEKYPVHVQFSPSSVRDFNSRLKIKPYGSTFKYVIQLSGYGGSSKIVLEGVNMSDQRKYWLDVGPVFAGERITNQFTIRNTGSRAAYVKALVYTDTRCKTSVVPNRYVVKPDEFILKERDSKTVAVVFNPTELESALCNEHSDVIAAVAFIYGDEVSRQRFRRSLRDPKADLSSVSNVDPTVRSLDFNVPFIDESLEVQASAGPSGIPAIGYLNSFYSTMTKEVVALVGEPPRKLPITSRTPPLQKGSQKVIRSSVLSPGSIKFEGLSLKGSEIGIPLSPQGTVVMSKTCALPGSIWNPALPHGIPVRDSNRNIDAVTMAATMPMLGSPIYSGQMEDKDWVIKPDQIILHASSKRDERPHIAKFQITNFQNRELRFELSWPGHWIKVTPEMGKIEPKSSTTVCISPSAAVSQNLSNLPWSGGIYVSCDNLHKIVKVQIRTDILKDNSVQISNKTLVPLYSQSSSRSGSLSGQTLDLSKPSSGTTAFSTQINFPATKIGDMSETTYNLENPSSSDIRWIISSFAPPYVKGADTTNEVFRATYKVFEFSEKFGHLQTGKSVQVKIQFMPRSAGTFTQHWDVQCKSDSKSSTGSTSTRIQLCGEGIQNKSIERPPDLLGPSGTKDSVPEKKNRQVILEDTSVNFPSCAVGQTQLCKIQLKNESSTSHTVEVINPQLPFLVMHKKFEIKPRRYLKFPVQFKPSAVGSYEGLIVFRVDVGYGLSLKLEGECKTS